MKICELPGPGFRLSGWLSQYRCWLHRPGSPSPVPRSHGKAEGGNQHYTLSFEHHHVPWHARPEAYTHTRTHLKTKVKANIRRELHNPPSFPSAFPTPSSNHVLLLLMYEKVPYVIWAQGNLPSKYRVMPNDFILTSWHRTPKLTCFTNGQGFPQCLSLQLIARLVGNGHVTY